MIFTWFALPFPDEEINPKGKAMKLMNQRRPMAKLVDKVI